MKHLLSFKSLSESTSAFSQERSGWDYKPFKYAKNYDPRVGYSSMDFLTDIISIYKSASLSKRKGLMDAVTASCGIFRLREIENLPNDVVNRLMKDVEIFLSSKSNNKMQVLPDGFILCFENMSNNGKVCDIYYSPFEKLIKVVYTDYYPESEERLVKLDEFKPELSGIKNDDFKNTIEKCDAYSKITSDVINTQNSDKYFL